MHSLYQQQIMDHYHFPRHKGTLTGAHCVQSSRAHPSCGDQVSMSVCLEAGAIKDAKFDGIGCVVSLAVADMLLATVIGRSVAQAQKISLNELKKMVGIEVGPTRLQCVLLSLDVLNDILRHA